MFHTWLKEIAIDPYEGPHIIWHKITPESEWPDWWHEKIKKLEVEDSPDGRPWKMKE